MRNVSRNLSFVELELLEARRQLLAARAESLILRQQKCALEDEIRDMQEELESHERTCSENLAVADERIRKLESSLGEIYGSRRWRVWNAVRYVGR